MSNLNVEYLQNGAATAITGSVAPLNRQVITSTKKIGMKIILYLSVYFIQNVSHE